MPNTSPIYKRLSVLNFTAITLCFIPIMSASAEPDDDDINNFVVLGAASNPSFEGSSKHEWVPFGVANLNFGNMNLEIYGLEGTLNILDDDTILKLGPAFSLTTPRDEIIPGVPEFSEVDFAIEVGGFIGFETPFGDLQEGNLKGQLSIRHDIAGAHSGFLITPEIEYFFAVNRMLRIGVAANTTWASNDYMSTYFGITPEQRLISDLQIYNPGSGFKDIGLEGYSILSFSERWGIFSRVSYNRLLEKTANSPIITQHGDRNQFFYGAGLFYRF